MYTKQESARLRQAFWTAFGQYMAPAPSAGGEKINWLNYKTGIRHLYFKTDAEKDGTRIAIVLAHPDAVQQQAYYEQLLQTKKMLEAETGEEWIWQPPQMEEGKIISRVYRQQEAVNVFNQRDWSAIISFLKPRLMALDAWWQTAKYGFELLAP
jgi:hypothetical protein